MKLQNFIPCLLTISHGNADVERSLSHSKNVLTSERSSLSLEVLIGLRLTKDNVKNMKANLHNISVTQQMQDYCRSASAKYKKRKEEEQRQRLEGKRDKTRVEKERQDAAEAMEKLNQDKKSMSLKETEVREKEKELAELLKIGEQSSCKSYH